MRVAVPISLLFLFYFDTVDSQFSHRRRRCPSRDIRNIIVGVVDEVATSPEFNSSCETAGIIANILKRRVQLRYSRVYEIIVSRSNFAVASYSPGDNFCKLFREGIYALAYETPHQTGYHAKDKEIEAEFSSISDPDPLGTSNDRLPGQAKALGVELESDGYRLGFPKGSHCDQEIRGESSILPHSGYICCHQALFQSMHNSIVNMEEDDSYYSVDRRVIAQRIRQEAEIAINQPLELVISPQDFEVVSHHKGDCVCKFRAGENTVMAWRTPGNWSVGVDIFADGGRSSFRGCNRPERNADVYVNMDRKRGKRQNSCCNQTLQYTMMRNLDKAAGGVDSEGADINEVSRYLARTTQRQLNHHVETIVSKGDFAYRAGALGQGEDTFVFKRPLPTEFLNGDVEPSSSAMESMFSAPGQNAPPQQSAPSAQNQAPNVNPSNQPAQQAPPQQSVPQQAPAQQAPAQQAPAQQLASPQQAVVAQQGQAFAPQSFAQAAPAYSGNAADFAVLYQPYQCFSEDTWVITETGIKNMSQLKVGDFVMTANSKNSFFVPIVLWLHKTEEVESGLVEVSTTRRSLFISPRHFIYRANCAEQEIQGGLLLPKSGEIYAQELVPGDCLYVNHEGKWILEEVVSIKMRKKRGLYAPLTDNGKIIVNGILASCFTDVREPVIQNVYFEFISKIRKIWTYLLGWTGNEVDAPKFLHVFEDLVWLSLPYSSQF